MAGQSSRLIRDLNSVPAIIGALGLNVAEAQKAFNLDYMDNLERLLGLIKSLLEPQDADGTGVDLGEHEQVVKELLTQLAPSRYQFTETTLDVRLDLAQNMDLGTSAGFSAGIGALAVNAAVTVGFGYDYRAAARVRTTLHAIPAADSVMSALMNRVADLDRERALTLPAGAQIDRELVDKAHAIVEKLTNRTIKVPTQPTSQPGTPPGSPT